MIRLQGILIRWQYQHQIYQTSLLLCSHTVAFTAVSPQQIRYSSSSPVKLDCYSGFPLVLITTNIRSVFRKAHRLEPRWIFLTYKRRQARHNFVSVWCHEIWNREAFTCQCFMQLILARSCCRRKSDAVTCGRENVCSACLLFLVDFYIVGGMTNRC